MANFHMEVGNITRWRRKSIAKSLNYISGQKVRDNYLGQTFYRKRDDVVMTKIYLPANAPPEFSDMQRLCDEINKSEKRYDARTGRVFICSLPNELPQTEWERIVADFVEECFSSHGICAVAAMHEGKNAKDASRNNPHVHIIVATRTADENGFSKKKYREFDKRGYIKVWRKKLEDIINRAYERNKCREKVCCECYEVQGIHDIEPTIHLSRIDWQKEKRGERTADGDIKRDIKEKNKDKLRAKEREKMRKRRRTIAR